MSKTEVKKIVKKYSENLKKHNVAFDHIYLFGSYAKNNQNETSDIDVAVVSSLFDEKNDKKRFENKLKISKLRLDIDLRLEPHGVSKEEFENKDSILAYEIKKTGIEIK